MASAVFGEPGNDGIDEQWATAPSILFEDGLMTIKVEKLNRILFQMDFHKYGS